MIYVRIAMSTLKALMVLGIVEYIAPGLSHDMCKQLAESLFKIGGK